MLTMKQFEVLPFQLGRNRFTINLNNQIIYVTTLLFIVNTLSTRAMYRKLTTKCMIVIKKIIN